MGRNGEGGGVGSEGGGRAAGSGPGAPFLRWSGSCKSPAARSPGLGVDARPVSFPPQRLLSLT